MVERFRVCWLVPSFPSDPTDPNYTFLGREALELCDSGEVDLTVFTEELTQPATWDRFGVIEIERPTTTVEKLHVAWSAIRSDPSYLWPTIQDARGTYPTLWRVGRAVDLLRVGGFDVVHSHFAVPQGTCGVAIARRSGAASVVSLRGVDLAIDRELDYGHRLQPRFERVLRRSLRDVDHCLTATDTMRELAISAGAPRSKTSVLPNSFSAASTGERIETIDAAQTVVVSVGRLVKLKGFDRGVRALAQLPRSYHYVIVGDGPEQPQLQRLAQELDVEDRVHFLGRTSPAVAKAWLEGADVVWFLSRVEAFGNVLLEAFHAGTVIIATRSGVAPDLLADDVGSTLLADPDDPDELAQATQTTVHVDGASRAITLRRYTAERRSADLLRIYRSVLERAS